MRSAKSFRFRESPAGEGCEERGVPVLPDEGVPSQEIGGPSGGPHGPPGTPRWRRRRLHGADTLRDEGALRGLRHAHRNVGISPQEILVGVGERQLDLKLRMRAAKAAKMGGKTATPTTSLHVTRTVPCSASDGAEAERTSASATLAIDSA